MFPSPSTVSWQSAVMAPVITSMSNFIRGGIRWTPCSTSGSRWLGILTSTVLSPSPHGPSETLRNAFFAIITPAQPHYMSLSFVSGIKGHTAHHSSTGVLLVHLKAKEIHIQKKGRQRIGTQRCNVFYSSRFYSVLLFRWIVASDYFYMFGDNLNIYSHFNSDMKWKQKIASVLAVQLQGESEKAGFFY